LVEIPTFATTLATDLRREEVSVGTRTPGPLIGSLLRAPVLLYEWHLGWLLGRRFLLLCHVGRRSGHRYRTVLEVVGSVAESGETVVVSGFGRSADWYRNVRVSPTVEVTVGRQRFRAVHRELAEPEALAVLTAYERRNRWIRPVLRRVLGRLVGWPYDGSDEARRRLVGQLPLVAFRPTGNVDTGNDPR
jgi:deazaflavin-dependent oxidoreductase (nitroreductase family)